MDGHPLPLFVGTFVPLLIEEYKRMGAVPDAHEVQAAKEQFMAMIECQDGAEGGAELFFLVPGKTGKAMSNLLRVLAILAFAPGGVRAFGYHFDADARMATPATRSEICWADNNELSVEDIVCLMS